MEKIRLSKLMAEQGLCSRREADSLIERGWVYVDGKAITKLGTKIYPGQVITLDKRASARQARAITILLNKPVGCVSAQPEKGYPSALSLIKKESRFKHDPVPRTFHTAHLRGLAPAGRLDIDSTGLLVLTQDGRIARQLIGENAQIEKEYLVRVQGTVDETALALLCHGLHLDGRPLRPAQVSRVNQDQLMFILREGRKRQIRRMCEQVSIRVIALKRVRIGNVRLANLPLAQWRYLGDGERF